MASQKEVIKLTGRVVEALRGTQFRVELENGHIIIAHMVVCVKTTSVSFRATESRLN